VTPEAKKLIEDLKLTPHPEGGFYREVYRAPLTLMGLPHGGPRSALTSIYFMLPAGVFSVLHRVRSDEVWHHYDGDPLELHLLDEWEHSVVVLGRDIAGGQVPQYVVRAGLLQAAVPRGERFSLCGCTVAPGFEFTDFEMPSRDELLHQLPKHSEVVKRLTRPPPANAAGDE
jgi:predicted cupin superfamily sugar epimerase